MSDHVQSMPPGYARALAAQREQRERAAQATERRRKTILATDQGTETEAFTAARAEGEYANMLNQPQNRPLTTQIPVGAETSLAEILERDRIERARRIRASQETN